MKGKKVIILANLNCIFKRNEEDFPMLEHFDVIIEAIKQMTNDNRNLFLYDLNWIETKSLGYCLYGKIIKNTNLEIASKYHKESGVLEELPKKEMHHSSPYSEFVLILQNHRILFTPSQKGSPTIQNLQKLFRNNIKKAVKDYNREKEDSLELKDLNILELPKRQNIYELIKQFKKISIFSLKFIQLNNDLLDDYFENTDTIKQEIGSNEVVQIFKNPSNKKVISTMIEKTDGKVEVSLRAKKEGENMKEYKNGDFKERIEVILPEHNSNEENVKHLIDGEIFDIRLKEVSKENQSIYTKMKGYIKEIVMSLF